VSGNIVALDREAIKRLVLTRVFRPKKWKIINVELGLLESAFDNAGAEQQKSIDRRSQYITGQLFKFERLVVEIISVLTVLIGSSIIVTFLIRNT